MELKLNKETGEIHIPAVDFTIGPELTPATLLASPVNVSERILDSEDGRRDFQLSEDLLIEEMNCGLRLVFVNDLLDHLFLWNKDAQYDQDPVCWDEHKELMRMVSHDRWLEKLFGNRQNEFPWGFAVSDYNPIAGESHMIFAYHHPNP
jgi:hypothetical protein